MARKKDVVAVIFLRQELETIKYAAGNILEAGTELEVRQFFGSKRRAAYAQSGFEKLERALRGGGKPAGGDTGGEKTGE